MKIEELPPQKVWQELVKLPSSALIDVRTGPEWAFVGVVDLSSIGRQAVLAEWRRFPDMRVNDSFVDEVKSRLGGAVPENLYFICRSGTRSRDAANCFAAAARESGNPIRCVNVVEGFEGDLDDDGHRGNMNGWKRCGLAWRQS